MSIATLTDGSKIGYAKKELEFDADLWKKIRKETGTSHSSRFLKPSYVDNISQASTKVNIKIENDSENFELKFSDKLTQGDREYMELAQKPEENRERLQKIVDQRAKDAG